MLLIVAASATWSTVVPAQHAAPETGAAEAAGAVPPAGEWTPAPGYLELFAPELHRHTYGAYTSPQPLAEVIARLMTEPSLVHPPGAWQPRHVGAFDAFGGSGTYDRWRLTRLYTGRSVEMAVGPHAEGGRIAETWTLVSPYPDVQLTRLEPGTLLLVAEVSPLP